ncbi:MAG: dihydropteroate synthase [Kiritimatiellae bacterium]|nr:dihydropteroate synthase [Kiritimatiellia bacterium]MDD5519273.1 dihydropteroate synthase [Kiritimatiellia bacterium]
MKRKRTFSWKCRDRILTFSDHPLIMGILNVTPDSFSDGGCFTEKEAAVKHGIRLLEEGADIIDVGGESTRPGAVGVTVEEEIKRVVPVVDELFRKTGGMISVDTRKAAVAERALEVGACIVNDVSAMTHDDSIKSVVAKYGAGVILMHMRGTPKDMQNNPQYENVVTEVSNYLNKRVDDLVMEGLTLETMAIDPGIGFGKTVEQNLSLLAGINVLVDTGLPVVVGVSRKSFIGKITGAPVDRRLPGSLAALAICVTKGIGVIRVHDVQESKQAVQIAAALTQQRN